MLANIFANLIFMCITANVFAVISPLAAAEYGVSDATIGLMGAALNFIPIAVDIPLAGLTEHFGKKKVYRFGLLLGTAAILIPTLLPSAAGVIAGYLLYKFASTIYSLPLLAMISLAATKLSQAKVQGINGFLQGICAIAGSMLSGILKDHYPIRVIYICVLVLNVTALLLSALVSEEKDKSRKPPVSILETFKGAAKMLRENKNIQKAAALETIDCFVIYGVYTTFFGLLVTGDLGFSASFLGILLSVRVALSTAVNLFYPVVSERFGMFLPPCVFFIAGSIVILLIPDAAGKLPLTVLTILLGIFAGLSPAAPNTLIGEGCDSEDRSLGYAVVSIASGIICTGISLFFSLLAKYYSIGTLFRFSGIGGIFSAICSILYFRREIKRRQTG